MNYFLERKLRKRAYKKLIKRKNSFLYETGWMRSLEVEKPVDQNGAPVPWMNFTVVSLLKERLHARMNIFEYGSGYSTLFFARYSKFVQSLEYDESWYELISKDLPENVNILYKPQDTDGAYCRAISEFQKSFDVVIVDGRDRVNCVKHAMPSLTSDGIILLDDSHREEYQPAFELMRNNGFKMLTIPGVKSGGHDIVSSTLFYKENNCMGI